MIENLVFIYGNYVCYNNGSNCLCNCKTPFQRDALSRYNLNIDIIPEKGA